MKNPNSTFEGYQLESLRPIGTQTYEIPKKKTTFFEVFVVITLFLIAVGLGAYYLNSQKNDIKNTDNQEDQMINNSRDLQTIKPYGQSDFIIEDNISIETQEFSDKSLGIQLNVPTFMSFDNSDPNAYTFTYSGKYAMPGTEGDQDRMTIMIFRDLELLTPASSNLYPFEDTWEPTQELKAFGDRQLQAFKYIGPSELLCKLYIFNANDGKVGGLCFNSARRFVVPGDGGIVGDSSILATADLARYNAIMDTAMKSVRFTTTYQNFSDSNSGFSAQIPTKFSMQEDHDNIDLSFSGSISGKYAGPATGGEADTMLLSLFSNFDPSGENNPQYVFSGMRYIYHGREISLYEIKNSQFEKDDCFAYAFKGNDGKNWAFLTCYSRHLYDTAFTGWDFQALVDSERMAYGKVIGDIVASIQFTPTVGISVTPVVTHQFQFKIN